MRSHPVQYKIIGDFTQILEVDLPPEKTIITDAAFLLYFDEEVHLEQRSTDGADEVEEEAEEEEEGMLPGEGEEGEMDIDEGETGLGFGQDSEDNLGNDMAPPVDPEAGGADDLDMSFPPVSEEPELEGLDDSIMGDLEEEETPIEFEAEEEVDPSKGNLLGKLWTATRKKVQSINVAGLVGGGGNSSQTEENDEGNDDDGESDEGEENGGLPEGFDPESIGGEFDHAGMEDEEDEPGEEMPEPEPEPEPPAPERIFTHLSNQSEFIRKVALAPAQPCHVLDIDLGQLEDKAIHICKGSFVAAAKGTEVSTFAETDILLRPHHTEGLVIEKLEGDGMVFIKAKGDVVERILNEDAIQVNLASVVAFEPSIELNMDSIQSLESLQEHDPVILALFSGSGMLWMQSNQMTPNIIQHITQEVAAPAMPEPEPEPEMPPMFDDEPEESPALDLPDMSGEMPPMDIDEDLSSMPLAEDEEGDADAPPPARESKPADGDADDDDEDIIPPEIRALADD